MCRPDRPDNTATVEDDGICNDLAANLGDPANTDRGIIGAQQAGDLTASIHVHKRAQYVQTHITRRGITTEHERTAGYGQAFRDVDYYKPRCLDRGAAIKVEGVGKVITAGREVESTVTVDCERAVVTGRDVNCESATTDTKIAHRLPAPDSCYVRLRMDCDCARSAGRGNRGGKIRWELNGIDVCVDASCQIHIATQANGVVRRTGKAAIA